MTFDALIECVQLNNIIEVLKRQDGCEKKTCFCLFLRKKAIFELMSINRRAFLTSLSGLFFGFPHLNASEQVAPTLDKWRQTHDRVWLGGEFWSNPMEDWQIQDGWATCLNQGANRSIHSLIFQIQEAQKGFEMSVEIRRPQKIKNEGGAGFRLGVRSDLNEVRSNCFAGGGIDAGVSSDSLLLAGKKAKLSGEHSGQVMLYLQGKSVGDLVELTLKVRDAASGKVLGTLSDKVAPDQLMGNVALVSQYKGAKGRKPGPAYQFRDWRLSGGAFSEKPEQRFGPILWSMYTLSDSRTDEGFVMKISALTGPMGKLDNQDVELEIQKDGKWKPLGKSKLDPDAWVATFRIPNWDEKVTTPYRLIYREKRKDGKVVVDEWSGEIRANPVGRPLRMGALTCQNDYGFPYEPVANNLVKLDLDLLYFSGDQLYENHGGFGIIRSPAEPAILNYLRKYYQFGWSFRESMRNAPTICLPDDHDVFHGNIWGEGGAPFNPEAKGPSRGGYRQAVRMVNAVHRTNCAHHPDFHDPTPSKQDISVYYGDMVYGNVGFIILADRQWKSGPERVTSGLKRLDHVVDADYDTSQLDQPGLEMLGERQEKYLAEWAKDWRGHELKVLLSQTVFSALATHHGSYNGYLKGDLDSGGWPQTPRNRAIELLRPAMALHINGDQHLASLSQYGVDQQRDSSWSFCTPAIAAGYPRWWRPDEMNMPHENRPPHDLPNTGEYLDGFGNKTYVWAVGNPVPSPKGNRYERAHLKGSGFGLVTMDTEAKTYTLDCFRFGIDATDGKEGNQFPGWPVTIQQKENRGENVLGVGRAND